MKIISCFLAGLSGLAFSAGFPEPAGLASSDWSGIRDAYEADRHAIRQEQNGTLSARNPGQQWKTEFDGKGFTITPDHGDWTWGLELMGYGERSLQPVSFSPSAIAHEGGKITCRRDDNLTEWFINDSRGLEQGWTIHSRSAPASARLTLTLALRGGLRPQISGDGSSVSFQQNTGRSLLNYGGLKAWDADGQNLIVRFEQADGNQIHIAIDEQNARYPITIDPVAQQAYLKASNTESADIFGYSVAISGDTVVVGAVQESSSARGVDGNQSNNDFSRAGAAYVFIRTGTVWTQQAYLKASNTGFYDTFGISVAISGDTIVVGAYEENSNVTGVNGDEWNNSASGAGAAYVFTRSGTQWTQQAYLKASNTDASDQFGCSVSVSGDTVVVGASSEDSITTGIDGNQTDNSASKSGAAYIFRRDGLAWTQQAYLKPSNTEAGDQFGHAVAVSGNTVIVGARMESSNATGLDGDQSNNSAVRAGAAYVFTSDGTTWSQQAYLKASNTGASDQFGTSVAVSGDTAVVGALNEDSNASGVDGNQSDVSSNHDVGAAYIFTRSGTVWSQQAYLKASNPGGADRFGVSVAVSGDTVVVGSFTEDSAATGVDGNQANNNATSAGASYVFTRNGTAWTQQAYLKASNTGANDEFGTSVSVSGDTVVVGAPYEASNSTGVNGAGTNNSASASGSAYVFDGIGVSAGADIRITSSVKNGQTFSINFISAPGLTGWRIKGSANLDGFPDDLTPVTSFTEVAPGNYQSTTNLTGYPAFRYFLRIER